MHWGHAICADLVHWEDQAEAQALSEDYNGWNGTLLILK